MKILMISPRFPYPPFSGGKARLYNLIKHLSRKNEVYLLSFIEIEEEKRYIPAMENFCQGVFTVLRKEDDRIGIEYLPRSISMFYTPDMIGEVAGVVKRINPDVVQIDFLIMAQYVNHIKNIPVVFTKHDMSNINFEKSVHDRDLSPELRFAEWGKIVDFEKEILSRFSSVIVLTERDRKILKKFSPACESVIIPTGVDVDYFQPVENKGESKNLLYLGHYKHYPNADALHYFLERIFPQIVEKVREVKFVVVGSGVDRAILRLQDPRVIITGEVEDVREYFKRATVFVAPIRLGGGIKGKVLEAMASGVPVVATEEVGQGIRCHPGKDILVAKNDIDFASKTIDLLNRRHQRMEITKNARRLVEKYYDWKKIVHKLNSFYERVIETQMTAD